MGASCCCSTAAKGFPDSGVPSTQPRAAVGGGKRCHNIWGQGALVNHYLVVSVGIRNSKDIALRYHGRMRWLVDGYNVIRRSPELSAAERQSLEAGRRAL